MHADACVFSLPQCRAVRSYKCSGDNVSEIKTFVRPRSRDRRAYHCDTFRRRKSILKIHKYSWVPYIQSCYFDVKIFRFGRLHLAREVVINELMAPVAIRLPYRDLDASPRNVHLPGQRHVTCLIWCDPPPLKTERFSYNNQCEGGTPPRAELLQDEKGSVSMLSRLASGCTYLRAMDDCRRASLFIH